MPKVSSKRELRILADFNRGKLTAKQARKMIAKIAVRKTGNRNKRSIWK